MIKSAIIRVMLPNINCATPDDLQQRVTEVGVAIQKIVPGAMIDPQVECEQTTELQGQDTAFGRAVIDGYMEVKRKDGRVEYFYNDGVTSHPITKETYDAAHASPKMQAQLKSAREAAGVS